MRGMIDLLRVMKIPTWRNVSVDRGQALFERWVGKTRTWCKSLPVLYRKTSWDELNDFWKSEHRAYFSCQLCHPEKSENELEGRKIQTDSMEDLIFAWALARCAIAETIQTSPATCRLTSSCVRSTNLERVAPWPGATDKASVKAYASKEQYQTRHFFIR